MKDISEIADKYGGIISAKDLNEAEYKRVLRATKRGELIRIRHGMYATPDSLVNFMTDIEKIVPNGIVCLYSAWSLYSLTTTIPPAICVAVAFGRKIVLPDIPPINLYHWKQEYLDFGITEVDYSGFKVKITDVERSVCDAIRYRNKIGVDICGEILRNYLKRPDRNLSRLMDYAQKLRVAKILNNYLEISLE